MKTRRLLTFTVTVVVLAVMTMVVSGYAAPGISAQGANRASLYVVFGPDDVFESCVSFSESEIAGVELLRRSGLNLVSQQVAGLGVTVCKVEETGCNYPGEACFCKCLGAGCQYWSYWTWNEGTWLYSGRGAAQRMVQPGEIDAWVWGDGQTEPPAVGPEGACASGSLQQATDTPVPPDDGEYNPYPDATNGPTATPPPTSDSAATPEATLTSESYPGVVATNTPASSATSTGANTAAATAVRTTAAAGAAATGTLPPQTPTMAPDRSASVIARAATNAAMTQVPYVAPEAVEKRSYWAFFGIALLLGALIAYVLLLRRQRARK